MAALAAAHPDLAVAPVLADQVKPPVTCAAGAIGLVGQILSVHQKIQVAAQGSQAYRPADDEQNRISEFLLRSACAHGLERAEHAHRAQNGQQQMCMGGKQLTLVPLAKAQPTYALSQAEVERVARRGGHSLVQDCVLRSKKAHVDGESL